MRGFWFVVSTAFRVTWRGTWQAHSLRLITGLLFAALAALFAYLATGRVSALVAILAYPAGLILLYGFDSIRWLTGWRWRWGREWSIQPDDTLRVSLMAKGPLVILPRQEREEASCVIRDPAGSEFRADYLSGPAGQPYCMYPIWFSGAPQVVIGTYWVLWLERKPIWRAGKYVGPGKWHTVDFYPVKIADHHLPAPSAVTQPTVPPGP